MDSLFWLNAVGFVLLLVYVFLRTRITAPEIKVLSAEQTRALITEAQRSLVQIERAMDAAPFVVNDVEELWKTGKIKKEDRLGEALVQLATWFDDLDTSVLTSIIEITVFLIKRGYYDEIEESLVFEAVEGGSARPAGPFG